MVAETLNVNVNDGALSYNVIVTDGGVTFGEFPEQPNLEAGMQFEFDNGLTVIPEGSIADINLPFSFDIESVQALAPDESGDIVADILITDFASYPGGFTSIVAAAPPTLSSERKYMDSTLTGWTKNLLKGDILRVSTSGVVSITKFVLTLSGRKNIG